MREIESSSMFCTARGSYWQITAKVREMERRGDVRALWEHAYREGVERVIPYVRLRTLQEVRRRAALRLSLAAGTGLVLVSTIATVVWQARHLLLSAAGMAVLVWSGWWVARLRGHSPGCVGLHCPGCKG